MKMNNLCRGYMIPTMVERLDSMERLLDNPEIEHPYHMTRELRLEVKFLKECLKILGYVKPAHPSQLTVDEILNEPVLTD
jgi:hypothetical protein